MPPLTVRQLTEIPYLRTRIHAGADGADQSIGWAHSIEMPRPWEWLEEGDLLMTVGLGIPSDEADQVGYISNLAAVGISGVAIGDGMHAPPLSDAMMATAERLALPVLFTAFEVPFVQISRAVGAANHGDEHTRLVRAVRIYDRVRADVARNASPAELLQGLAQEIQCRLHVCANDSGASLFPGAAAPPAALRDAFSRAVEERGGALPGILRLAVGGATVLVVPVPARRSASLLAVPNEGTSAPPYALLQHVATVLALEVGRIWAEREELRRLGSETLASLLDGRISTAAAAQQLRRHGMDEGPFALVAVRREGDPQGSGWLHHALADREVPHMLLRRSETLLALLPAGTAVLAELIGLFDEDARIGVSDPFDELDGTRSAAREARWALAAAQNDGQRLTLYGDQSQTVFGPRSISEARTAVEQILGPVLAYDAEHGTDLVPSLATFLRCNRSWQRASAQLFVHKQTLVYRMQRLEQLTGRKLNETAAVAQLWLAVQALELLGD
ncbi:MAG: Purine catabolism regulatory protein-like family [Solirubrobacterales bacterium]|jgi:purine catabolism regulator|nr:Purine catabolism regulatory protein-like family [Solirubrobacterales bacterium]